jgi:transitional endoplasmic reticulum ATPase
LENSLTDSLLKLLPGQRTLLSRLDRAARAMPVVACLGPHGMGRTTVLRQLAKQVGADFIDLVRVMHACRSFPFSKREGVVLAMIRQGLKSHGTVIFDGYSELVQSYAAVRNLRDSYFLAQMAGILSDVARKGQHLILGGNMVDWGDGMSNLFGEAAAQIRCDPLGPEDYAAFFAQSLGDRAKGIDFKLLHGLAPHLSLYQLNFVANRLADAATVDFDTIRACLEGEVLHSNLRIGEVEALSFDRLPGSEHIAQALETHVVLPFEHPELAAELDLKPRRGVLLYGPPGTGKTSIGRALAHRMKGRFFLIDGSVITEPPAHFFLKIDAIVAQAKANAPCVLFIDDADVLFQIEHVQGLARYLLSLLDGIESETASKVCIMLTAMDAGKLPSALLRSGRVELWLETRTPDEATRARILERWMPQDMLAQGSVDFDRLANETEGFTPADLRRLAGDAKLFYAADVAAERTLAPTEHYLDLAVRDLADLRAIMDRRLTEESRMTRYHA